MAVTVDNYSLYLLDSDGNVIHCDDGHTFALRHCQEYTIEIHNLGKTKINASIEIDTKQIGTFRVNEKSFSAIERPVAKHGKLTFYETDSSEGRMASIDRRQAGSIVVTIHPEVVVRQQPKVQYYSYGRDCTDGLEEDGLSGGGTGLGAYSNQQFRPLTPMQTDKENSTTIIAFMRLKHMIEPL